MSTPVIIGVGAIAAALAGRTLVRRGIIGGRGAAEQWVKGGFKAKMDRKEAIAILGLKCVHLMQLAIECTNVLHLLTGMAQHYGPKSKMPTVKLCLPTTPIVVVHPTLPVKLTRRKTFLRRRKGVAGDPIGCRR